MSTTAFILGSLEEERGLAEWVPVAGGPVPTLQAEKPQVSRAQHLAEPGAKIPEPELRAGVAGGLEEAAARTWASALSSSLPGAYLCLQQGLGWEADLSRQALPMLTGPSRNLEPRVQGSALTLGLGKQSGQTGSWVVGGGEGGGKGPAGAGIKNSGASGRGWLQAYRSPGSGPLFPTIVHCASAEGERSEGRRSPSWSGTASTPLLPSPTEQIAPPRPLSCSFCTPLSKPLETSQGLRKRGGVLRGA